MKSPLIFNAFVLNSLTHLNPASGKIRTITVPVL